MAKKQSKEVSKKPRCGLCKSGQTYHRKRDDRLVCVTCGNSWPAAEYRKQLAKSAK